MPFQNDYVLSHQYEISNIEKFGLRAEHSYSKFDWGSGNLLLPTIYLFTTEKCRHFTPEGVNLANESDVVDVESKEDSVTEIDDIEVVRRTEYDVEKARHSMEECERYASMAEINGDSNDEVENPYSESTLNGNQRKLCKKVIKILKQDRLARLAYKQMPNEAILRRIFLNRSAAKIKRLLSSIHWDSTATNKLHMKFITSLDRSLLPIYFDVLQTLMAQVPKLIESMLRTHMSRLNVSANEALDLLLGTSWCPVTNHIKKNLFARQPFHPEGWKPSFIFIRDVPPSLETMEWQRRWRFFSRQLSSFGGILKILDLEKVRKVTSDARQLTDVCLMKITGKVTKIKSSNNSEGPVVLIGRNFTSLLACEASNMVKVDSVVCLGFPMPERRTCFAKFDVPTLFVVGERDENCSVEELEKFRSSSFKSTTGLVVVGGANTYLRMSHTRQLVEEVLQPMIDRCIVEKIAEFLDSLSRNH